MMCSGKMFCDIYRDKKYCRKDNQEPNYKQCNCAHAVLKCDVEKCAFEDRCQLNRGISNETK